MFLSSWKKHLASPMQKVTSQQSRLCHQSLTHSSYRVQRWKRPSTDIPELSWLIVTKASYSLSLS